MLSITNRVYFSSNLSALIEISAYLACTGLLLLSYELNWISLKHAGIGVLTLLLGLVFLSWFRLDSGRHPCFLFLCMLPLFQAGRLIESAMGSTLDPFQISLLAVPPFDISSDSAFTFLLALSLSAVCIYAPCRWNHRRVLPDRTAPLGRELTYLYIVFCITLPFSVLKNILLLQYASAHGGYLALFTQLDDMIANVPAAVRFVSGLMAPAFLAIFVLESRKVPLYICTVLYFLPLIIFLLIGSRGSTLTTILALWCVSSIKTRHRIGAHGAQKRRTRFLQILALSSVLILIVSSVDSLRNGGSQSSPFTISSFIAGQDSTMGVTELAIEYRAEFSRYAGGYFAEEIGSAFGSVVAKDQSEYTLGKNFSKDATVFLNPDQYNAGFGIGGSYLGEAYIAGAIPGVILVSLFFGFGLNLLYRACSVRLGLFVNALILPSVFWTIRGEIFDWIPALVRSSFLILILYIGWQVFTQCTRVFSAILRVDSRVVGESH